MDKQKLWERTIEFHGHECGGLIIGYRAALLAMELLDAESSAGDEEIVCIAENDSCSVDAVQALLGCTAGKGNLLFKLRGKQAFSFFNRTNGKSARVVLKNLRFASSEEKRAFIKNAPAEEIFEITTPRDYLPCRAEIYKSFPCEKCGEVTAEPWLRIQNGQKVCLDCYGNKGKTD